MAMGRVLIAGFTAALLLLGTVLIYLMRAPRSRREVLDVASLPPPAPSPARRPLPAPALAREVATAPEGPRVSPVGRLSGRVMGGDEAMMASDELAVAVVDESGSKPAVTAATKGREFQARLPPGTYTVTARIDELVGKVSGVQLNGREEIQILLVLQPASVLAGRVVQTVADGELPLELEVLAYVAGTRSVDTRDGVAPDGSFELAVGPGVYDLELVGPDIPAVRLTGVQAPADGLELRLERIAVLSGAIGMPPGESCGIQDVTLLRGGEELDISASVDAHCRFQADGVPAGEVLVRATGPGWLVEGTAFVPTQGKPAFLCLNPPCSDIPVARLEIAVDQSVGGDTAVVIEFDRGQYVCKPLAGRCQLDDLTVGQRPRIWLGDRDCPAGAPLPALLPGLNRATVSCHPVQVVEAAVRPRVDGPPAAPAP
jgi:hypothetical protein